MTFVFRVSHSVIASDSLSKAFEYFDNRNYQSAFKIYKVEAEKGIAEAQFRVALIRVLGKIPKKLWTGI